MELADLDFGVKACSSTGHVLNCQELVGIQAGLAVLKSTQKYGSIYFWGKIFGETADYYIAYGLEDSEFEFPSKSFFYSEGSSFEFKPLQLLTEEVADKILELALEKPFTGKPDSPLVDAPPAEEGEEATNEAGVLTEADRLAQVVMEIDFDSAVVPKGAYALNEAHIVVPSVNFTGLGASEASVLESYVHFRSPTSIASLRALARDDVHFYGNFLDPLAEDLPKGCWAVRQDPSAGLVTIRSLSWPGYTAFHAPQTSRFGGAYFGYAQKCKDLPFLL